MTDALKNYLTITFGYWAFTITDGAIRMLVVLYFHQLGYSPFEVAMLFLFYEFFGVITNLVGGWLGSRIGLNLTMHIGMAMQIVALMMLTVPDDWLGVAYVMAAQALSGIAKDLNKMSAKASVKKITKQGADASLFKWVAILTGSKNALKGAGFFVGAALLTWLEFRGALYALSGMLLLALIITFVLLPNDLGKTKAKAKFSQVFSNTAEINWLSAARFFLFGARDVWFVVALPVYLYEVLGWAIPQVGAFLALWVIGYGFVQAAAPKFISYSSEAPHGYVARDWAFILVAIPAAIAWAIQQNWPIDWVIIIGLIVFAIVFAINSAVHSYLILAYSDHDKVSMNVGFYYMSNAGGRLLGTVLSGATYQIYGLNGCLWLSSGMVLIAALLSFKLPNVQQTRISSGNTPT